MNGDSDPGEEPPAEDADVQETTARERRESPTLERIRGGEGAGQSRHILCATSGGKPDRPLAPPRHAM